MKLKSKLKCECGAILTDTGWRHSGAVVELTCGQCHKVALEVDLDRVIAEVPYEDMRILRGEADD